MEAFLGFIVCLLSLIGAATLIRAVVYLLFKCDLSRKSATVIFLDDKTYEMTIRSAVEQAKWKKGAPQTIIALDNGLSDSAKRGAVKLLNNYSIMMCENDDILKKLRENFKK